MTAPVDIVPPYTALEIPTPNHVRPCFGKLWDLSTALPTQIYGNGVPLLAAPITLELEASSGGGLQIVTATPTLTSFEPGRAIYDAAWTGSNNIGATIKITIDSDGTADIALRLTRASSQTFKQIRVKFPLNPAICVAMSKTPRASSTDINVVDISSGSYAVDWSASETWPRVLLFHNGQPGQPAGLEWAIEHDANHNNGGTTGVNGQRARISLDVASGMFIWQMTNNFAVPISNGTQPIDYRFWLTPHPPKPIDSRKILPRFGDEGSTPALAQLDPNCEECPDSDWELQGTLQRKGDGTAYNASRAARIARNLPDAGYTSPKIWATIDAAFDEAWRLALGGGFFNYRKGCNPSGDLYDLVATDVENTGFQDNFLTVCANALNYTDHIYLDVNNIRMDKLQTDLSGRNYYKFSIAAHRDLMRRLQAICAARGASTLSHAQCDWLGAIHCFHDYTIPGEELRDDYEACINNARRRFYVDGIPAATYQRAYNPDILGCAVAVLPELVTSSRNFTVADTSADTCTASLHAFQSGQAATPSSTGTLPPGLSSGTTYYLRRVDANTVAPYDTEAHAIAGGATGRINITGAGSGTHTWTAISVTNSNEWLATECMIHGTAIHGLGQWHSFNFITPLQRYWTALKNFGIDGGGAIFRPYWSTPAPRITTADPNARISTIELNGRHMALIGNLTDTDRTIDVVSARGALTATNRYAGTGISVAEGRSTPGYVPDAPSGAGQNWTVGVGRKNLTLVEFTYPDSVNVTPPRPAPVIQAAANIRHETRGGGRTVLQLPEGRKQAQAAGGGRTNVNGSNPRTPIQG